jgi:hypothetical protein
MSLHRPSSRNGVDRLVDERLSRPAKMGNAMVGTRVEQQHKVPTVRPALQQAVQDYQGGRRAELL